jgi:serine protease Do
MMLTLKRISLPSCLFTGLLVLGLSGAIVPVQPVWAQTRALPDFTDLVDQVGPAVVNIRTLEKVKTPSASNDSGGGTEEQMLEFFRRFGIPVPPNLPRSPRPDRGQPEESQPTGVGSGFILSADGFVMTNAHVIEGADEVMVTLADKREFKAKIVGSDKRTDVAVVKIEATGLPSVKIGDANRMRVGEWVMAIGTPFGLENTVTAGIVSAKQRDTGDYLPLIQTDVAINPGNSGGPLINMRGEVVGINSQIYSRSGGFQGISFAIPIDEAIRVSDQLRTIGRVTRGRIGVQIDQVSKEVAESIGLGKPQGALVRGVEVGAPAEKAGIEAGDLTVAEVEPEKPTQRAAAAQAKPPVAGPAQALGLVVGELTGEQKKELKLRGGVRVDAVEGLAARAGLREDDVIVAIANTEVLNVKAFEQVLAKADKSKPINVLFRRGEWAQYAVIRPVR